MNSNNNIHSDQKKKCDCYSNDTNILMNRDNHYVLPRTCDCCLNDTNHYYLNIRVLVHGKYSEVICDNCLISIHFPNKNLGEQHQDYETVRPDGSSSRTIWREKSRCFETVEWHGPLPYGFKKKL